MTKSQMQKMKAMDLAHYACYELGLPERICFKLKGGPVDKTLLIESILEKQEKA